MRDIDERMTGVKRRMNALEAASRRRRGIWSAAVSVAVCLALLVGLSLRMPAWSEKAAAFQSGDPGAAASLFAGSSTLGYFVIGLLAFLLGVAVTVLCFRLKKWARSGDDKI